MGIADIFKAGKNKALTSENQGLIARVAELEALLTPEMRDYDNLTRLITDRRDELSALDAQIENQRASNYAEQQRYVQELNSLQQEITSAKSELIQTNEEILFQSFALYQPHYEFANSSQYKDRLVSIRQDQKTMIKNGVAASGATSWTVNGSAAAGRKMVKDTQKLLLRAFNCECDDAVEHVKFNNIAAAEKRIISSAEAISKLGKTMSISITQQYINLKLNELHLAFEYQVKKQEEKEHLRQLRAEERERAKVEREIAEERKKIEKEQAHYKNALRALLAQMQSASETERVDLENKRAELEAHLGDLDHAMEDIDYRAANQRAGYVYVISNIGAFGEGVYKIGMTRRLEPMDRIDELGDASVPFDFDVHALIFSDDAPALEAALHRAFDNRKLNMVNTRREFFAVSLDEIKAVVKENYDKTVEFIDVPPAEQYRESQLLRKQLSTVSQ